MIMKTCLLLLLGVLIVAISPVVEGKGKAFKFEDCTKGERSILLESFHINPEPISLSKNVSINGRLVVKKTVPPNAVAKRWLTKKTLLGFNFPIPCLFNIGSCSTNFCEYLDSYKVQACPFFPEGQECGCPLTEGVYVGQNVTVPVPDLSGIMKFLASGEYSMKVVLTDPDTEEELICFKVTAHIKM